jgi:hypothetical protein
MGKITVQKQAKKVFGNLTNEQVANNRKKNDKSLKRGEFFLSPYSQSIKNFSLTDSSLCSTVWKVDHCICRGYMEKRSFSLYSNITRKQAIQTTKKG